MQRFQNKKFLKEICQTVCVCFGQYMSSLFIKFWSIMTTLKNIPKADTVSHCFHTYHAYTFLNTVLNLI